MAIYIKKERLGSGPPPRPQRRGTMVPVGGQKAPQHPVSILNTIESMPGFQALKESYAESRAEKAAALKEKYEANAEVQRWRTQMTPEERTRDAIERMVPTTKEVLKLRNGNKDVSYEEARKKAEDIAYKSDKQKKDG